MDYYPLDNNPALFSSFPQSSYDVPSFDEAFDTKSLKDFYRQQSQPNIFASKCQRELNMEEEFRSQTFEAPSPATTVQSHSFFDMFNGSHYEDFRNEGPFVSNQNSNKTLQNYMSPLRMRQAQVAKGIHLNFGLDNKEGTMEKEPEVQKSKPEENLIALLCEQMKQYYGDNPGSRIERQGFFQNQQPRNVIMKNMDERNLMFNEEDKLTGTILRKLISKKKIFEIQRSKKDLEGKLRKGSVVVESNTLKEIKKRTISVELTTTTLFKNESLVKKDEEKKEKKPRKRNTNKTENGEKKEKKEKKEKTEKKSTTVPPQLNMQIGNNGVNNADSSANAKKVIFGNSATGMKDFGSYQMFSS